ncbi:MBL fold metallo-hydrolase [Calothrix sp. 336/3]|uniref:MBL fold metallo-hydrolase n=1 Tax=Calothrix sp. 336/3 TaxID=1337936 RepID=UPI0004E3BF70|nr:MBL fold metallo-hydrolase [Calothrix sp. 336/3]AKG23669.1 Zn-dependent hydrolase of beta-lactamase fold protein [Calothrix sp. 336/3]
MKITRIDLNSWLLQIANQTILVDPWLVDPLVFYGQPWLFTAYHNTPVAYTPASLPQVDLILISQGLDDHCHKPTLEQLDRNIPVVASPTATSTVKSLGYKTIVSLAPWQSYTLGNKVEITAVPGAEVQPGQMENGYVVEDREKQTKLYYEPHLFRPESGIGERFSQVDVAIAPVVEQIFPLLGQVIMGAKEAMKLIETLNPRFILPNAQGDIRASGILPKFIRTVGSVEEFRQQLIASGMKTELITPEPGETVNIELTSFSTTERC